MQAQGVTLEVAGDRLIDCADLQIRAGRRTVIMGANGAGKSLLLRLLHGLIEPSSGRLLWRGRLLDQQARRRQAMVFQKPVLLRRSVRANLSFALSVRGVDRRERKAKEDASLKQARLTELANRPARVLSGGEQQRLAVARALAGAPEALLLDEPTASLDPASTQAVEDQVLAAHADGVTIVLVTHDAGQARRLGEDVIFLHAGRVAETGPAATVLEQPRSEAARAWLDGRLYLGA